MVPLLAVAAAGLVAERRVDLADPPTRLHEGATSFALPEPGEAVPGWLPDHTPIFVVRDRAGDVHVVRALVREAPPNLHVAVAWCPPADAFVSVWRSDMFLADGRYVDGPAPTGLWTYETRVEDGRVHVGDPVEPVGRSSHDADIGDTRTCFDDQGGDLDRDVVVLHDLPADPADVRTPEEAATSPAGSWVLIEGYVVVGDHASVCSAVVGEKPPRCDGGVRLATSGAPGPSAETVIWHGLMRALADDADGFRRLEGITLEVVDSYSREHDVQEEVRSQFGDPGRVTVADGTITVPAVDIGYGEPPPPIPAGTYTLVLENHGGIVHTLRSEELRVALRADGGDSHRTELRLPPGEHTLVCTIPGHREAGMELQLRVE